MATPASLVTGAFLNASITNLYTSPAGTTTVITKMTLTNVTSSAAIVTIYLSGSTSTTPTSPLQTLTVPANSTVAVAFIVQHAVPAGGAILAAVACGEYPDVKSACDKLVKSVKKTEPTPELAKLYNDRYSEFSKIYPSLKVVYSDISKNRD